MANKKSTVVRSHRSHADDDSDGETPPPLRPTDRSVGDFGSFDAVELLSQGGGGQVWSARRKGSEVADLVIKIANVATGPIAEALRREWDFLFAVATPALPLPVAWLSATAFTAPAIVMQRRAGEAFDKALARSKPDAVFTALEGAMRAVGAMHAADLVHGDLHPGNILVDGSGHVALLDLGLAQRPGTGPAVGAGLPAFAAPERLRGDGVDVRDDIFSLAMCGWVALTGAPPFANYPAMLPHKHSRPTFDPAHEAADLLEVLAAWLCPLRELRPKHVEVAIREWQRLRPQSDGRSSSHRLTRRPWRWGQWGEPEIRAIEAGGICWLSGPPGSGRTGLLAALEATIDGGDGPQRTVWIRPSARAGVDALDDVSTEFSRRYGHEWDGDGEPPATPEEQRAPSGIGERGGAAKARTRRAIEAIRRRLGPAGALLVDDFELLPERLREALASQDSDPSMAAVALAVEQPRSGGQRFLIPAVTTEQIAAALAAASGCKYDREVCVAIASAVGCDRATVFSLCHRLLAAGALVQAHGRVQASGDVDSFAATALQVAALAAGDDSLVLPRDPAAIGLLAHLAVAGRCCPTVGGDPAPRVRASLLVDFRAVRQLPAGGYAVASERHRWWLLEQLPKRTLAAAADARSKWLRSRDPLAALELQVAAASVDPRRLPPSADVAQTCVTMTDSGEPARAVALAEDWQRIAVAASVADPQWQVVIADIAARTAMGRFAEVDAQLIALGDEPLESTAMRLVLADKAFRAGDYPAAAAHADFVLERAKSASERGTAALLKSFAATWQGDLDGADLAMSRAEADGSAPAVADAFGYLRALADYYRGALDAARAGFADLEDTGSITVRAAAAAGTGLCAHRVGDLDVARAAYDRSRTLAEIAGDRGRVLNMTMNVAVLDHEAGDLGAALSGYSRVALDAERLGNAGALARSRNNRGNLLTLIGDHAGATADLLGALGQIAEAGNQYLEGNVRCLLAEIHRKSGRIDEAFAQIELAVASLPSDQGSAEQLEWAIERAECDLAKGARHAAHTAAEAVLSGAQRLKNDELQARAGWLLARCELLGDPSTDALADVQDRLVACAAAVPEQKLLLRVAIDTDLAAVLAMRGARGESADLAIASLSRLERVAATLSAKQAELFVNGPLQAPRRWLLRVLKALGTGDDSATALQSIGMAGAIGSAGMASAAVGAVLALNRRLSAEHDLPRLLEVMMDAAVTLTGAERGFLVLDERAAPAAESDMTEAGKPDLKVAIARNLDRENLRKAAHKLSWSVAVDVFDSGDRVVTTDASADPRFADQASVHSGNLRSILCVPLALRGRTIGVLYVDNRFTSGAFTHDHAAVLDSLAAQAAIAIHTARLIARYALSQTRLEHSKEQVESLNEKLQERLAATEVELTSAREALDAQRLEIERRSDYRQIKGESAKLRRLFSLMDRVRKHDFPVIVYGESGTGKELVARAIHFTGARKSGPFVAINCGAVPENLLESELFGHKRGAFTGAVAEREGLFVSAHRGTLFLDEIGEMPASMQVKLLRVLQTGEVQAVGGSGLRKVDVRVLAATHRDLGTMVAEGTFREDLLYRLRVVQLHVPALRERTEDLPILCEHFLANNRDAGLGEVQRITADAMRVMSRYPWPGNVRELETFLKSACLFAIGSVLDLPDVQPLIDRQRQSVPQAAEATAAVSQVAGVMATGTLAEIERAVIDDRLHSLDGNKSATAQSLGIDRGTLYNKLRGRG